MSRVFSIRTVLRQTSNALVREFLSRLAHTNLAVSWDGLSEKDIEPIHTAIRDLSAVQYDEIESILRTFYDLACDDGIAAIREAATALGDPAALSDMPKDTGLYDQVVWAWLNQLEVVQYAELIHQVENLPWWRRRSDLPKREPNVSPGTLRKLETELSSLLYAEQGRGRRCTVEILSRTRTRYYFAYPDDHVLNINAHDDHGQLVPRTFRRTFSVVFAFDPIDGSLELFGKLPPKLKQQVEAVFARVVFGVDLGPWAKATYELDRLKYRGTPLPTDPADRIRVSIREMRLRILGTKQQITLKADPDRGPNDIYDMINDFLVRAGMPLSAVDVDLVSLCFEFELERGRGRTMTFQMARPNTCSLRNQRQDRIDLAMKYLTQWGIYGRRSDPGVASAGM